MVRYRGFRCSILQWCYQNRKLDSTLLRLQRSVNELNQALQHKQKKKKGKRKQK
ncbi:MAG: hypothetical protein ACOX8E_10310 [Ruminococcus sp.]